MKNKILAIGLFCITLGVQAQDIKLPSPEKTGGKPIMEALNERRSERSYVKKEISEQMLSNLLWAANGFNRDERRTAPTAMNKQEMELYVMFDSGIYFYDAKANILKIIAKGDFKDALGQPQISDNAALSIIMVADTDKSSAEWARVSTGYISQNIYLFAASEDLGTVARGSFKKEELAKALQLKQNQEIILVQPIGFLK